MWSHVWLGWFDVQSGLVRVFDVDSGLVRMVGCGVMSG